MRTRPGMDHPPAIDAVEAPGYLVRAAFLHGDVEQGAFRARKNDIHARCFEHHMSMFPIRIKQESGLGF